MPDTLPAAVLDLLRRPSPCFVATVMPDGRPQVTETWVDTDGEHVLINTVGGFQKLRNLERDPRVTLAVADHDDPSSYVEIRGRVVATTEEGGAEHIEQLARRYTGGPYAWYGGRDQVRVIVTIAVDKLNAMLH